ncbi:hypothetical protein [Brevibacillus sp. HD3.3A]|uniref:hypothetical protein n=1 Tax=Brevibacillus sp. HD3.3A TaxID=2738979 RepID=UPI00156AC75D|nr:hypothetical protein [Brevibacillus sp. HD3.3A]UED70715.1 hypothetical protein HP435_08790 [Brevibacillus sp. HD3.3A]
MLVARWNIQKDITLEEMQNFNSSDRQSGMVFRIFDGVCASDCATYLIYLIARTIFNDNGKLCSCFRTKKSLGEIVLMEAEDTGNRCMDRRPIVKPTTVIKRIPVAAFIDWRRLRDELNVVPGEAFSEIRDLLDAEHQQEIPYSAELKFHGYIELDKDEQEVRMSVSRDKFKAYLQGKYNAVIKG